MANASGLNGIGVSQSRSNATETSQGKLEAAYRAIGIKASCTRKGMTSAKACISCVTKCASAASAKDAS